MWAFIAAVLKALLSFLVEQSKPTQTDASIDKDLAARFRARLRGRVRQ